MDVRGGRGRRGLDWCPPGAEEMTLCCGLDVLRADRPASLHGGEPECGIGEPCQEPRYPPGAGCQACDGLSAERVQGKPGLIEPSREEGRDLVGF